MTALLSGLDRFGWLISLALIVAWHRFVWWVLSPMYARETALVAGAQGDPWPGFFGWIWAYHPGLIPFYAMITLAMVGVMLRWRGLLGAAVVASLLVLSPVLWVVYSFFVRLL